MAKKVESIKHKTDTRAHIPSKEEAGYEDANGKVSSDKIYTLYYLTIKT
jgi:adenine-specific DNA-methyltransferase